jgi:hypothetical protein
MERYNKNKLMRGGAIGFDYRRLMKKKKGGAKRKASSDSEEEIIEVFTPGARITTLLERAEQKRQRDKEQLGKRERQIDQWQEEQDRGDFNEREKALLKETFGPPGLAEMVQEYSKVKVSNLEDIKQLTGIDTTSGKYTLTPAERNIVAKVLINNPSALENRKVFNYVGSNRFGNSTTEQGQNIGMALHIAKSNFKRPGKSRQYFQGMLERLKSTGFRQANLNSDIVQYALNKVPASSSSSK